MVRWPFLGPGAEGLREVEEEEGGLRRLTAPWAIFWGDGWVWGGWIGKGGFARGG